MQNVVNMRKESTRCKDIINASIFRFFVSVDADAKHKENSIELFIPGIYIKVKERTKKLSKYRRKKKYKPVNQKNKMENNYKRNP